MWGWAKQQQTEACIKGQLRVTSSFVILESMTLSWCGLTLCLCLTASVQTLLYGILKSPPHTLFFYSLARPKTWLLDTEKTSWRRSDCMRWGPFLPSAAPHRQFCPPWRCHTGYSASCAAHTFCPDAEETNADVIPTEPRHQCVHTGPKFQISHSRQEETSVSRFLYIDNS